MLGACIVSLVRQKGLGDLVAATIYSFTRGFNLFMWRPPRLVREVQPLFACEWRSLRLKTHMCCGLIKEMVGTAFVNGCGTAILSSYRDLDCTCKDHWACTKFYCCATYANADKINGAFFDYQFSVSSCTQFEYFRTREKFKEIPIARREFLKGRKPSCKSVYNRLMKKYGWTRVDRYWFQEIDMDKLMD